MNGDAEGRQVEQILSREGALLRLLMDNVPEYVFLKDCDLRFVQTNKAHAAIIGLADAGDVVGKTDADFHSCLETSAIREIEKKVIESGVPAYSVEQMISSRWGDVHWLSGHRIPVKDDSGIVIGLIGLVRNITSVKKIEQELRNVNMKLSNTLAQLRQTQQKIIQHERLNALGEMASGVAHDFNNALMPILGYTDVLISRPELLLKQEETLGMLKDIRIAAMDAAQAVRRLREFYRTSSEDEKFKGDLNKQIETAIILTRPKWQSEKGAQGIQINVRTNLQEIPMVNAKESQLREILINLMLNAIDAMPKGGTITINTRKDTDHVILEVCDDGIGMTDEVRHRCFEPFFTTKGDEGTGLGLSMAYGFVKRRNGLIDVVSTAGKGTKLIISLPSGDGELADQKAEMPIMLIPKMRILVVDDDAYARNLFAMYLKADNHTVEFAAEGKEGLAKFNSDVFDLVITDRAMQDMSGDQLATMIRAINRNVPIIMVTGFGDIMNENRQCPEGVSVVVSKPVTHSDLQRAIAQAINSKGRP
jgi:PAS domain S-box-containing protein